VRPIHRIKTNTVEYFQREQSFEDKVMQALQSYSFLKQSEDPRDIKLIEMMDDEIKLLFEQAMNDQQQSPLPMMLKSLDLNKPQQQFDEMKDDEPI
jgi:uncharacterized protein YqgQ